jgi:hypothetical protein
VKQTVLVVFLIVVGCFVVLFAYVNKQTTLFRTYPSIRVEGTCSLYTGKRISINCHPDLTTIDCSRLPKQKCHIKKIKNLKNIKIRTKQVSLAKSLLTTPQKAVITLTISPRGKIKIKQLHINNQTLNAD